jgi:hypothetical protein
VALCKSVRALDRLLVGLATVIAPGVDAQLEFHHNITVYASISAKQLDFPNNLITCSK